MKLSDLINSIHTPLEVFSHTHKTLAIRNNTIQLENVFPSIEYKTNIF